MLVAIRIVTWIKRLLRDTGNSPQSCACSCLTRQIASLMMSCAFSVLVQLLRELRNEYMHSKTLSK